MAVAHGRRAAHRKAASIHAIVISPENRNRALAIAGSGAALTMIAGTAGAAVVSTDAVDVVAGAQEATRATIENNPVTATDVEWQSDAALTDGADSPVADTTVPAVELSDDDPAKGKIPEIASDSIVATALQHRGVPYVFGASDPNRAFDCSGFVSYIYGLHGIKLPHQSRAIYAYGTPISPAEARPGDVLFWNNPHVGIYIGNGMMIDATYNTTTQVRPIWGHPQYVRIPGNY